LEFKDKHHAPTQATETRSDVDERAFVMPLVWTGQTGNVTDVVGSDPQYDVFADEFLAWIHRLTLNDHFRGASDVVLAVGV
jgi:hypothetical protein